MRNETDKKAPFILLRHAIYEDAQLILEWRNDQLTRKNSINGTSISQDEHEKWFLKSLLDPNREIFICEASTQPVGMIRLDKRKSSPGYILSWAVATTERGRGIGSRMLKEICNRYSSLDLIAEIKENNYASISMVVKCGFSKQKTKDGVETWIRPGNEFCRGLT